MSLSARANIWLVVLLEISIHLVVILLSSSTLAVCVFILTIVRVVIVESLLVIELSLINLV